eukprot:90762-Pelagomonas_calceolata.AAC.5
MRKAAHVLRRHCAAVLRHPQGAPGPAGEFSTEGSLHLKLCYFLPFCKGWVRHSTVSLPLGLQASEMLLEALRHPQGAPRPAASVAPHLAAPGASPALPPLVLHWPPHGSSQRVDMQEPSAKTHEC